MKQFFTFLLCLAITCASNSQERASFEEYELAPESFLNDAGGDQVWLSGNVILPNTIDGAYWSDWSLSTMTDVTTPGFTNQYSAIAGGGGDASATYATAYILGATSLELVEEIKGTDIISIEITNSTYAYLSMRDGDSFAKKFGGLSGDDPDYLKLTIKGYLDDIVKADSIDVYLADFRFDDNSLDYILDDWSTIDLAPLGPVDYITFELTSTDNGSFGMNTPSYICIDNVVTASTVFTSIPTEVRHGVYPNPVRDVLTISDEPLTYVVYDRIGQTVYSGTGSSINVASLSPGMYTIVLTEGLGRTSEHFIKY